MCDVNESCEYIRARKNVIIGGAAPLICITALSCLSSFLIYRAGFGYPPFIFQQALALFAVVVVEGAFVWLVYDFTRAVSSGMERLVSLAGMGFLVVVRLINLVTHFMMVKHVELSEFQVEWIEWGAVTVFIAVFTSGDRLPAATAGCCGISLTCTKASAARRNTSPCTPQIR